MHSADDFEADAMDVSRHLSLGESFLATYWAEGHASALAGAVVSFRSALCQARDGVDEKIKAQIGLADALRLEVDDGTGGEEERMESLTLAESAASADAHSEFIYHDALRALGEVLFDRNRERNVDRLQRTVDTFRRLVELTSNPPRDITVKPLALYAQSLSIQCLETGDPKLMELANSAVDDAISIHRSNNQELDAHVGIAFMAARLARSILTSSVDDVDQAIAMAEKLIARCPPGYPWLSRLWSNLGTLYSRKRRLIGGAYGLLDECELQAFSEARKRLRPQQSIWQVCNGNYAMALFRRAVSHSGNLEDLKEAIDISRSVVSRNAATGYKHPNGHGYLTVLAAMLIESYAQLGNLDALNEAVTLQLDHLEHVTPALRPITLIGLGVAYRTRYSAHGRTTDLDNAIASFEQALPLNDGVHRAPFVETYTEYSELLLARVDQDGQSPDMEKALTILRAAVDYPTEEADKDAAYLLLGTALLKRGKARKDIKDIEESIQCQRKALDLFSEAHSRRAESYHGLGRAEFQAFILQQRSSALHDSITAYNDALTIMPPDHPNRAACLLDLATSLLAASETRTPDQMTAILSTLADAAKHVQSWPVDRYSAAALWARTAHRACCLEMALEAYQLAISILPQVAWLGLEDELRLQRLSHQPPDISQDAAACAIELGLYNLAVEIIDGSRSILWNTSQELRADLGKLREVAPDLAQELAQTNAALAFRPGVTQHKQDERQVELERQRVQRLATRRTELLHLVRSIPGFQRFLMAPSYDTLHYGSRDGPVVILISSAHRCDALILQHDKEVTLVPLPKLTHRVVLAKGQLLQKLMRYTRDQRGRQFLDRVLLSILRDIWEQIGKPIWLSLDSEFKARPFPRLWWCPTGALTSLPFHACGPYNGVEPNMADIVISSYTPTIAALLRSRNNANSSLPSSPPRMLVVSEPETLTRPPLPCALDEARVLYSLMPSLCTFRIGPEGTVAQVKDMLHRHNWLHVSSHGSQDIGNPLESCIALYDGDLKLSELVQERIPDAEFAFLSACHSARGPRSLPDEAMHLAAGMMFAGFRSVVATSWAIADRDAPIVTKVFYGYLVREGRTPEARETAEALHVAVKHLRDSGVPLHRWIPFIHLGV